MKTLTDAKEIAVLTVLSCSKSALGSWTLAERLEEKGIAISSATAGRVLSNLERIGYVKKEGFSGRIITEDGRQALQDARAASEYLEHQETLENALMAKTLNEYILVLQARRAIEREIAGLAAKNITEEELQELKKILKRQAKALQSGESVAGIDVEFHQAIAKSSRNPILESLYHMLSPYGQQSEIFEKMRKKVGHYYSSAHLSIFKALEIHDPELAERMMVDHIDGLMEDITTYWEISDPSMKLHHGE